MYEYLLIEYWKIWLAFLLYLLTEWQQFTTLLLGFKWAIIFCIFIWVGIFYIYGPIILVKLIFFRRANPLWRTFLFLPHLGLLNWLLHLSLWRECLRRNWWLLLLFIVLWLFLTKIIWRSPRRSRRKIWATPFSISELFNFLIYYFCILVIFILNCLFLLLLKQH